MAWTTPKTWSDTQDRLNAANLNTYIRDNQLALRADHAALVQRIDALGFGTAMMRDLTFRGSDRNKAKLTDLSPPSNIQLIYLAVRQTGRQAWHAMPLIEYAIWNSYSEVAADALVTEANRWPFTIPDVQFNVPGFVAKGVGGVLAFGIDTTLQSTNQQYDRVCVRWYL